MPGDFEFTAEELDALFNDDEPTETTETTKVETDANASSTENTPEDKKEDAKNDKEAKVENTRAFAHRLKESTDKARLEERENIAKSLGYNTYDELIASRDKKLLEDKELDADTVLPVVEELVKKRIEEDPRMQELAEIRKQRLKEFGDKELNEIKKLTNGEITSLAQLPKEVIDLWKQNGSLKSAYLQLEGEKLINKVRSEQSKGSTSHLQNPSGSGSTPSTSQRFLTAEEKRIWKQFNPYMTDEELNKKTVEIKNN